MTGFPLDLTITAGPLVLSRPTYDDLDDLVAACEDPETVRFTSVPSPYSLEHARGFVEMCAQGARDGTSLGLLARDPEGRLQASCGLVSVDHTELVGEIGYWVAPWARRQGVATEAARAVARYAFDRIGLHRLQLQAATINIASNQVARRLGFLHEGTLRSAAPDRAPGAGDARFDMEMWGLLPGELT